MEAAGYRPGLANSPVFPQNPPVIMQRVAQAREAAAGRGSDGHAAVEPGKPALPHSIDRGTYAHR